MRAFYCRFTLVLPLLLLAGSQTAEAAGSGATGSYRYPMTLFLLACVFMGGGMVIGLITRQHPISALLLGLLGPTGWVILLLRKPPAVPEGSHQPTGKPPEPPPSPPITRSIAALKREAEANASAPPHTMPYNE